MRRAARPQRWAGVRRSLPVFMHGTRFFIALSPMGRFVHGTSNHRATVAGATPPGVGFWVQPCLPCPRFGSKKAQHTHPLFSARTHQFGSAASGPWCVTGISCLGRGPTDTYQVSVGLHPSSVQLTVLDPVSVGVVRLPRFCRLGERRPRLPSRCLWKTSRSSFAIISPSPFLPSVA